MTSTTDVLPGWVRAVAVALAALVVAGMINVLGSEITWRNLGTFALAAALTAAAMFVVLRNVRVVVAVLVGATAVYASRAFLSSGLINGLDVGLLVTDDIVGPFIGTWIALVVLMAAVMVALEVRRKILLIAVLTVIAVLLIPTRFPDLV